jgi:hypothetical protein
MPQKRIKESWQKTKLNGIHDVYVELDILDTHQRVLNGVSHTVNVLDIGVGFVEDGDMGQSIFHYTTNR